MKIVRRPSRIALKRSASSNPLKPGMDHIGQQEIKGGVHAQRLVAWPRLQRRIAQVPQRSGQGGAHLVLVLDDQDRLSFPGAWSRLGRRGMAVGASASSLRGSQSSTSNTIDLTSNSHKRVT
jgi:hypothetical protein